MISSRYGQLAGPHGLLGTRYAKLNNTGMRRPIWMELVESVEIANRKPRGSQRQWLLP